MSIVSVGSGGNQCRSVRSVVGISERTIPALSQLGLALEAVRRAAAALSYGRFVFTDLLVCWNRLVQHEEKWFANDYGGFRPVACDTTGFFRPQLVGCRSKHYTGDAQTALPAVVLGLVASVGTVGGVRVPVLRHVLRGHNPKECEADLKRRLLKQAGKRRQALGCPGSREFHGTAQLSARVQRQRAASRIRHTRPSAGENPKRQTHRGRQADPNRAVDASGTQTSRLSLLQSLPQNRHTGRTLFRLCGNFRPAL